MKNLSLTFCLAIAALASPVWSESFNDLVIREGLLFPKFSDQPFNGRVDGKIMGNVRNGLWDGEYLEFRDDGQLKIKIITIKHRKAYNKENLRDHQNTLAVIQHSSRINWLAVLLSVQGPAL